VLSSAFRVLVIEDDEAARANLRDILEIDEYQVETVGSAAEALRAPDLKHVGAILLDRKLPDALAEDLLPRLKHEAPDAAILIITGYADLESAIKAMRQGAADYLLKPINPELLRTSLARFAERRRLAAELQAARHRALQAERLAAIGEVYTGLAHESRNALQRSQSCLERLAKRVRDVPGALDLIDRIQKAQDHLHSLYEEVRSYAAPLTALDREPYSLGLLLRQTWENLAVERKNRDAKLVVEATTLDLRCPVDPHRIEQVFRNILENALSACPDPAVLRARWVDTLVDGRPALEVRMVDSGPGLSAEARRRIFEPFYTTKTKGTGLGMAITRRIVEAHGGSIRVGDEGPGAEIIVVLPREIQ
jgi:signal transduction histidine kinase